MTEPICQKPGCGSRRVAKFGDFWWCREHGFHSVGCRCDKCVTYLEPDPADQPAATETRCHECHMTSQHKLQCSRRNEPLADQPAETETRPHDLYEAHVNGHVYKAPTYTDVEFSNCDNCGEQFGARWTRLCPVVKTATERCPDCLRLDGQPHATTCKQYERW